MDNPVNFPKAGWRQDERSDEIISACIPSGPKGEYCRTDNLLDWMGQQFETFGDIYKTSIIGTSVYVTRDPEFAHHVLVENWHNYVKGQSIRRVALLLGNGLMVSKGEFWKRQRRMIQPAFNHQVIGEWTDVITNVNSALHEKWQLAANKNESVNVTRDVSAISLEIVLRLVFGSDYEQVAFHFDLLLERARDMAFTNSFRAIRKIVLDIIDQRRRGSAGSHDILRMLMQARDSQNGESMHDDQLVSEVFTLIVAGHETTASTLNWTWYLISQHPEVERNLVDEVNSVTFSDFEDLPRFLYTRQIINEAMRLYPPGWLLTWKALSDDYLREYFVPAGTEIYVPPYFIQRNPKMWKNPDQFDPDRFRANDSKLRHRMAMIPFSAGPRNCIGEHLARTEMQIHLLTIAGDLRLRYIGSTNMELDAGVNLRSKYDFIMYPETRTVGTLEAA
jgi:cytochrome P450